MSDTGSAVFAVPVWIDAAAVLDNVLDVLRKPANDPDADRIEQLIPAAAALTEWLLDRDADPLPPAPPMHPLVETAMTNLTIELYRRKDAPFGVLNAFSIDEFATRISNDVLRGVRHLLLPLKIRFGVA